MKNLSFLVLFSMLALTACSRPLISSRSVSVEDDNGLRTKTAQVSPGLKQNNQNYHTAQSPSSNATVKPAETVRELRRTKDEFEFEAEGYGSSTKYEKPLDAEKRAEDDALAKAVKAAGINVYAGSQDVLAQYGEVQYQFVGRYLNVWTSNLVRHERSGPPVCAFEEELYKCTVKIRGTAYFRGEADPGFDLKADLDKPAYFDGDDVNIQLSATKDAYITVISCDEDGNAAMVFPNKYARNNFLKANQPLNVPRDLPFRLKATIPKGRAESGEILHIIATKNQPLFVLDSLKEEGDSGFVKYSLGGLKDLVGKLSRFNRSDWTAQIVFYGIKGK